MASARLSLIGLVLLSIIVTVKMASACSSPRMLFDSKSASFSEDRFNNSYAQVLNSIRKSDAACRYQLLARADAMEVSTDQTLAVAKQRGEAVMQAFVNRGASAEQFEIVIKPGMMSRSATDHEALRA